RSPGSTAGSAAWTTVSVAGRGSSVSALTLSGRPQNSLRPRRRATGSRASRRAESAAMAPASSAASMRLDWAASAVWSSPSAWPTMMRASSSGPPTPPPRNSHAPPPPPPPAWAPPRRQHFRLMLAHQRVDDLAQRFAFHHLRQLVEGEIDAVVPPPPLRKIIGADALGAIAGADLPAPLGGARRILLLTFEIVEPGAQHRHGLGAIAMLGAVFLHHHDDASGNVGDAHGRFGLVDVLAAGAAGAQRVDLEVVVVDVDIDVGRLRQHGDGGGRGMDAARPFGIGHALHAMNARFEFEFGESAAAANFRDDLLEAAHRAFAQGHQLDLPALRGGVAFVHAEQIAGEERGL